jgi:hypothetical protein
MPLKDVADLLGGELERRIHVHDEAQDLGDGEHADHHRDQADAAGELGVAEREARVPRRVVEAHAGDEQSEQQRDARLEDARIADEHRAGEAEHHHPEILEVAELERDLGQRRRRGDHHSGAKQAANGREHQPRAQGDLGLALLRHGIGFVGICGRGRRSGNAQQRAGNVAGEDRHRGRGHDRGDRRHRRHEEGDRHQQRRGHGRGEAGDAADEQAEQCRGENHRQHVRVEDQRKRLRVRVQHLPHLPHHNTGSTPQGSGTRSSL